MDLGGSRKKLLYLTLGLILFLIVLGGWWVYLIFSLGDEISHLDPSTTGRISKFFTMMKWEGLSFFLVTLMTGISILILQIREHKNNKAIQSFFASLSHELRTPLTSIRLQGQAIQESLHSKDYNLIEKTLPRLLEDTTNLELELEKTLQLSWVERKSKLDLQEINIKSFLENQLSTSGLNFQLETPDRVNDAYIDPQAMKMIIRNIIQNTLRHSGAETPFMKIRLQNSGEYLRLEFKDNGQSFKGDPKKLGRLFYKAESPKGTGIGLYLISKLANFMGGRSQFSADQGFRVILDLKRGACS